MVNGRTKRFFTSGEAWSQGGLHSAYYYTRDRLGSIREMADSSGAVVASYDYDAWGRVSSLSGSIDSAFGYAGYYVHAPSGLYLTQYRAYDSNLGRWLSRDPLGELVDPNLYRYVDNDPVGLFDPSGRAGIVVDLDSLGGDVAFGGAAGRTYSASFVGGFVGSSGFQGVGPGQFGTQNSPTRGVAIEGNLLSAHCTLTNANNIEDYKSISNYVAVNLGPATLTIAIGGNNGAGSIGLSIGAALGLGIMAASPIRSSGGSSQILRHLKIAGPEPRASSIRGRRSSWL